MNKMFALIGGGVLTIALLAALVLFLRPARNAPAVPTAAASSTPVNTLMPALPRLDAATPTPIITPSSEYMEYIVSAEDTCDVIALNFNIPVQAILEKNNLSPSCVLSSGQRLLLPYNPAPVQLYEVSNNPPADLLGEWGNVDPKTADKTRVSIQMQDGATYVNMFGNCQPTECDFRAIAPTPAVDYNYDVGSGILHVTWVFDFVIMTQELTITTDGQLKVATQNHYIDDSGRTDSMLVEYFARQ